MRTSAAAGLMLAVAGCAHQAAGPRQASEQSCRQFGIVAIEHRETVRSVPAACRGLTRAQVNAAVAEALHEVAGNAGGKARQRARVLALSPSLAYLVRAAPAQAGSAPAPGLGSGAAGAAASRPASRLPFGVAALLAWLATAGAGAAMIARRIIRRLPSPVIVAHAGLALAGLLAWTCYLATGLRGAGWTGCGILVLAISLGVALISLWLPEQSGRTPARHPPAIVVAAHGMLAVATLALALAAIAVS
jgi:hypothetical protein